MEERKRKGTNWGSAIGWVIFLLLVAGGPILRTLQNALGNTIQLTSLLPFIVGGLVLLSVIVSAVRAIGSRPAAPSAPQMPDQIERPYQVEQPYQPLPPLGGEMGMPYLPPPPSRMALEYTEEPEAVYQAPRFEPVFPGPVIAIGLLGLLVLGGAALAMFAGVLP